jgi:hypothetical protein
MKLSDDLVDIALMVRGLRTPEESRTRWAYILGRLRSASDSVRRLEPGRRRRPDADRAIDWLHRSIVEAPIAEGQRTELEGLIGELKRLVAAPALEWRAAPPPRQRLKSRTRSTGG